MTSMMRESTYQVDKRTENFFIDGFFLGKFNPTPLHKKFLEVINEINDNPNKEGFQWDEKYKHSQDFKPNPYDYSNLFLDILFDQNIPTLLESLTGSKLLLGDIALRRSSSGIRYMGWHRDTHFYKGQKSAGRIPPLVKLIMYPSLGHASIPQLHVVPGSQRRIYRHKILDLLQAKLGPRVTVKSSDSGFLIFNSSLQHTVASNFSHKDPSLRLFYNFCLPSQIKQFPGQESLHQQYENRLNPQPSAAHHTSIFKKNESEQLVDT